MKRSVAWESLVIRWNGHWTRSVSSRLPSVALAACDSSGAWLQGETPNSAARLALESGKM